MSTLMQSILVLTCAVALACPADAGEFYVSPKGDDAGDGRSPATAWKTTEKVNKSQFAAGDKILFERGGKWRGKTVCTRGNVVFSNRKNHLVFRNLVADETAGEMGVLCQSRRPPWNHNVQERDCPLKGLIHVGARHQFINKTGGDYTLKAESPAIDAVADVPELTSPDSAGNKRPHGKGADMGALERAQKQ